jgi:hypothetical protein
MTEKEFAVLACPHCGHRQEREIPQDKCEPFYTCDGCGRAVTAEDACCVFCAYADKLCPFGHR